MALVVGDSLLIGSPYSSGPPERVAPRPGGFEGFTWTREDRLIGVDWPSAQAIAVRLDQRPVVIDTLVADASFVTPSPDGKWLAYNSAEITELWIEPLPATGRRTQVATGNNEDPQWLSNSEFVFTSYDAPIGFERVTVSSSANGPVVSRRRWFEAPRLVGTPGQTFAVTPDGRILYVEGAEVLPTRYLRVIPNWVSQMKRAVDEANR
jgi:hypothetical protein